MNHRAYVKIACSLVTSSVWSERSDIRVVWVTMLALADQYGEVCTSIPGLARVANVTIEVVQEALNKFIAPDEYSRNKANEGRRIVAIHNGWRLLNYDEYRELMSKEERREYKRVKEGERRQRLKTRGHAVDKAGQKPAYAEAEAEAEASTERSLKPKRQIPPSREEVGLLAAKAGMPIEQADAFWDFYQSKGWMVGKTKMVSVGHSVAGWARRWREETAPAKTNVSPTTRAILHQKELDEVLSKMQSIRSTYSGHQNWSEEDKGKWYKLKARRDELKKLLGIQT